MIEYHHHFPSSFPLPHHYHHNWLSPAMHSEYQEFKTWTEAVHKVRRHARGHNKVSGILYYTAVFYTQSLLLNTIHVHCKFLKPIFLKLSKARISEQVENIALKKTGNKQFCTSYYCWFSMRIGSRFVCCL
jgi:hypothetical protein